MGMVSEFKDFAMRGNVVDMAVGIVIGGAFGKIVSALVDHALMPPIGLALGGMDFSELGIVLQEAVGDTPAVVLSWGLVANALVNFIIIAFALFLVVKAMNAAKKKEEAAPAEPPPPPEEVVLLREIRDSLRR